MLTLTIVVPTLWKHSEFPDYISSVADLSVVKEVIIIDNNYKDSYLIDHAKVKVVTQARNIYVNPAWNVGARLASGDVLCLLNDDLAAKLEIYAYVTQLFEEDSSGEIGLVGLDWFHVTGELKHQEILDRDSFYFGCLMFMRTDDYHPVPEVLKIWWGDDFLIQRCIIERKKLLAISGYALTKQEGSLSVNHARKNLALVLTIDNFLWFKFVKPLLVLGYRPKLWLKTSLRKIFWIK